MRKSSLRGLKEQNSKEKVREEGRREQIREREDWRLTVREEEEKRNVLLRYVDAGSSIALASGVNM